MADPVTPPKAPVITSANLPKPVIPPAAAAANPDIVATVNKTVSEAMEEIVAAPLIEPDFVQNVKPVNPNLSLRWVLYRIEMVTDNGRISHLRFEKALAQGYQVATDKDLVGGGPAAYKRDNGTKFVNGDLILMKIDRRRYKGAILYREQQAVKAMASVRQNAAATVAQQTRHEKISVFHPTEGELTTALKEMGDQGNAAELGGGE